MIETPTSMDDSPMAEPSQPRRADPSSEVCRHWLRGFCLYGERCRAQHPPELLGRDQKARSLRGNGRLRVRNASKTLVLRRWLLETFGRDFLRSGAGIVDVAGGKGQFSFEMVNLNLVPSTVWDPRELDLAHYAERLALGMYHRNEIWRPFLDTPDPLSLERHEPIQPGHVRMFFDDALIRALVAHRERSQEEQDLSAISSSSSSLIPSSSSSSTSSTATTTLITSTSALTSPTSLSDDNHQEIPDPSSSQPTTAAAPSPSDPFEALYYRAAGAVSQVRWSKKGLVFDPDAQALSEVANKHRHHNTLRGTSSAANATIESLSSTGEGAEAREGLQPWHEVRDTLLQCSLLVGLHPDQAVGAIVDFALTFNKPFAVLPCCVYSKHFPKRHLPGPPRKQVTSYEDLCQCCLLYTSPSPRD